MRRCLTCSYDSSARFADRQYITPDPATEKLALSISQRLGDDGRWWLRRSSNEIKQILRANEIVALMLYLCGYDGAGGPEVDDIGIATFLSSAYKNQGLFRSFLHLKLPHYKPPSNKPDQSFAVRRVSLGITTSNNIPGMAKESCTPRHTAILDLLSSRSRKKLAIAPTSHPRMCVADAIGLLDYLEKNHAWYICEAIQWDHPAGRTRRAKVYTEVPFGDPREERVHTLAYVIRWLVGLGPYEKISPRMGQDLRPMWGRLKWLRGLNDKDLATFKPGQVGWQGWKWLALQEPGTERQRAQAPE